MGARYPRQRPLSDQGPAAKRVRGGRAADRLSGILQGQLSYSVVYTAAAQLGADVAQRVRLRRRPEQQNASLLQGVLWRGCWVGARLRNCFAWSPGLAGKHHWRPAQSRCQRRGVFSDAGHEARRSIGAAVGVCGRGSDPRCRLSVNARIVTVLHGHRAGLEFARRPVEVQLWYSDQQEGRRQGAAFAVSGWYRILASPSGYE